MLHQIISHTPVYVWLILGLLVWRGIVASRDRVTPVRQLFVLPVVMLAISLAGIATRFGLQGLPFAAWLAGAAVAAALAWKATADVVVDRAAGTAFVRGSWVPLATMMAIFATKYALAIVDAVSPGLLALPGFAAAACAVSGLFSGVFAGRALRSLPALRPPVAA